MKQIDIREGARRQHRAVALFAVIQCWLKGRDGVVFQRQDLERLLDLERFKKARITWLREDLKDFFPYQEFFWSTQAPNSFASLFVCRKPLKGFLPKGSMSNRKRLEGIPWDGPRIDFFEMWSQPEGQALSNAFEGMIPFFADSVNYDERFLTSYLSLLAQGQISPQSLRRVEESEE
jgi:hypothetical protein